MAQLNNLIVTGSSRFLNTIHGACTDGTSGTTKYMRQDGTWQVPPNDNTDTKVTQTATTSNANYEVLFSGTADNTTRTEGARKSSGFVYNPNINALTIGTRASGSTIGSYSFSIGNANEASAFCSYAEGERNVASDNVTHAEGEQTKATNDYAHAEGGWTEASGIASHAEGMSSVASGDESHAEGYYTIANHLAQHVFGEFNIADPSTATSTARGTYIEIVGKGIANSARSNARTLDWDGNEWLANSLVIGSLNPETTIGTYATAFGFNVAASGNYSHAEGNSTTASGSDGAHAEGRNTIASGKYGAHAEGNYTTASGDSSHAEGIATTANHKSQHVFGEYNITDSSTAAATARGNYVEIVGNGTSSTRSNARTLNWSGNEWIKGTLTQGSSIEIKKNVADMAQEDGDKILNLRPVVFDYKSSEKDVQAERGFIAEEVKEIIPNLVTDKIINDEGETVAPASLNYIAMIPYLVKVCQRQQEEINELKQQINKTTN